MGNILLPPQYYVNAFLCGVCTWRFLEYRKHLDRNCQMSNKESIALSLAVMYLFFVISSTVLVRDATDLYSFDAPLFWSYTKILEGQTGYLIENILNVFMLMPIGILIGVGFDKSRINVAIIIGALISLMIEISQMLTKRGLFEFDDILHNTVGCGVGYVVCRWIEKKFICISSTRNMEEKDETHSIMHW